MKERKGNNSSYESKREKKQNSSYELREAEERSRKKTQRKRLRKQEYLREKKKRAVNKEFASVTYAFVCLFLLLMGYIGYFTAMTSQEIIKSPYNPRLDSMADRVIRGKILDRNGSVLAETDHAEDGSEYRYYPYRDIFAHVVGYSVQGKSY